VWFGAELRTFSHYIVLAGRNDSAEKIDGLLRSADYCFGKPVRLPELAAVLAALARRISSRPTWRLSVCARSLHTPEGHQIKLPILEFIFLNMLAQATGQAVSRKWVATEFGEDYLTYDQNRLDTLVARLRRKLEIQTGKALPVHTVRVVGFIFSDLLIIRA
jgi:DNA-binding response OmpR family regulator